MKQLSALLATALLALATATLFGCPDDNAPATRSPADTVRGYYETLYNNDTKNEDDVRTLTRQIIDEYFSFATEEERTTMELGLPMVIAASSRNGGANVVFENVTYETLEEEEDTARVRMTGTVRSTLPGGEIQERALDKVYLLANVDGKWKLRSLE